MAMEIRCMWMRRILRPNPLPLSTPLPPMAIPLHENPISYTSLRPQPNLFHSVSSTHRRSLSTSTASSPPGPVVSFDDDSSDSDCIGGGKNVGISEKSTKVLLKGMKYTELEVWIIYLFIFVLLFTRTCLFFAYSEVDSMVGFWQKWVQSHGYRPGQALMLWKRMYGNDIWAHHCEELEGCSLRLCSLAFHIVNMACWFFVLVFVYFKCRFE